MVIGASEKAEYCSASEYRVQTVDPSVELSQLRAESQSQEPGSDVPESSENLKGKKRCCAAGSNRMLGLCATVVEVGLESCAVGWMPPRRENWGDR
jgi:hypothetical protein